MKTKQSKLIMWNKNRISSFFILKNRSMMMSSLKHRLLKKKMIWNYYNNRLSSSSIIKRHKKKKKKIMDKDLIRKEKKTTTICDLPEEVLTDVLVRVSVKDILACVRVQQSWHSLIKTRMFITLHSNYHHQKVTNPNNKYLLFWNMYTDGYEIRVDDIQCEAAYDLTLKFPPDLSNGCFLFRLVSNGLICLFDFTSTAIHLWNPVIQKYKTLPDSPHPPYSHERTLWLTLAFGFVPQINDYLVVYMVKYGLKDKPDTQYIMTCVYSINTNSWKKITHDDDIPIVHIRQQDDSIFVDGIAYWVGYNSQWNRIIMCFDTKTEMLREILLPNHRPSPYLHAYDQSVVYLVEVEKHSRQLGMWVLKGNPMNDFLWEKKMVVTVSEDVQVSVMGLRNNGEPILPKKSDFISYNFDSHKSYDFVKSWDRLTPFSFLNNYWELPYIIKPFSESLDLLDID